MTKLNAYRYVHPDTGIPTAWLDVTEAPAPPATVYASDFSTTTDGWAVGDGDTTATLVRFVDAGDPPASLRLTATDDAAVAVRTVTGLTVGATYRFQVDLNKLAGDYQLGVASVKSGTRTTPPNAFWNTATLTFTATATSHVLRINVWRAGGTWAASPDYYFRNVQVFGPMGSWAGTRIIRTDVNGTRDVREAPGGNDTYGNDLSLVDYEAALVGDITYTVFDGNGGTATKALVGGISAPDDATWLVLPVTGNPGNYTDPPASLSLFKVTGWEQGQDTIGRTHQIIGRTNKVGNPGPLALRSGSFDVLGLAYADIDKLIDLLDGGDVAMLRQPTHRGLDLYFLTQGISVRADPDSETWTATVTYDEVQAP